MTLLYRAGLLAVLATVVAGHRSFSSASPGEDVVPRAATVTKDYPNLGDTKLDFVKYPQTKCKEHIGVVSLDPQNVAAPSGALGTKRVCSGASLCAAVPKTQGSCSNATADVEDCKTCAAAFGWKAVSISNGCFDDPSFKDEQGYTCDQWGAYLPCEKAVENYGFSKAGQEQLLNKCVSTCKTCRDGEHKCQYMDGCSITQAHAKIDLYQASDVVQNGQPGAPYIPPQTSPKECLNNCSDHGECKPVEEGKNMKTGYAKKCVCYEGWTTEDCSKASCPADCSGNGVCDRTSGAPVCKCATGWTGDSCGEALTAELKVPLMQDIYDQKSKIPNAQFKLHHDGMRVLQPIADKKAAQEAADKAQYGASA